MDGPPNFLQGKLGRQPRATFWLALGFLGMTAILIFARLGNHPLWDDEAGTALGAKGVLRTGDTSALVDDHNISAYRGGHELVNLRIRYMPPLQYYLTAPSLAAFGLESAWAARLPFALCGLACFALIFWWLWRARANTAFALLLCLGLAANVSLILYSRQCRYYAPGTLCCLAIAFLYLRWEGRRGQLLALALISLCLLALNYLYYLAFYFCLAVDYAAWGRTEKRLRCQDWLLLLTPQIIIGGWVVWVWNPLNEHVAGAETTSWLVSKATLFWWNWRDLNACEFGSLLLLALAPVCYFRARNRWLIRGPLALFIFVLVVTLCSPQSVGLTRTADVRLLAPVILLCVAIEALTLCEIARARTWLILPLGALVFGANLGNGGPLLWCGLRSTIADYVGEIIHPPGDPYVDTVQWINDHVRDGESIWVQPDYACYPLMFHAPKAVYAWQLAPPPAGQFASLPPIHFGGLVRPDYIIVFGPQVKAVTKAMNSWQSLGVRYEPVATIPHFWAQLYRPELFFHTFAEMPVAPEDGNAIYIFHHIPSPGSAPPN